MLNLCVFIFIIYAVSYSVKAILFPNWGKNPQKAMNRKSSNNTYRNKAYRPKQNVVRASANYKINRKIKTTQHKKIYDIKTGRLVYSKRPAVFSINFYLLNFYNPRTFVAIAK